MRWREAGAPIPKKIGLLSLDFDPGSVLLTEASPKKRAWVRVVDGEDALAALDPGGLEPLEATREAFSARLRSENHTLKRALTDPTLFSGIGNAYSDEILHAAKLSPGRSHVAPLRRGGRPSLRRDEEDASRLDGAAAPGRRREVSREGDRLPAGDGRARQVRRAVPRLRDESPAHRLRRQRDELLPDVPDRRQAPGGPLPVAPPPRRLAEEPRGDGGAEGRERPSGAARHSPPSDRVGHPAPELLVRQASERRVEIVVEVRALAGRGNRARDRRVREDPLQEELRPRGAVEFRGPRGQRPREDALQGLASRERAVHENGDAFLARERQNPLLRLALGERVVHLEEVQLFPQKDALELRDTRSRCSA